jgi:hypothetical protein
MQTQIERTAPIRSEVQSTFLPPIERPRGLMMKLVYAMTRRQFGNVLTPLKVFSARMPLAWSVLWKDQHFGQEAPLTAGNRDAGPGTGSSLNWLASIPNVRFVRSSDLPQANISTT